MFGFIESRILPKLHRKNPRSLCAEAAFWWLCCIPLSMARMRAKKSIRWLTTRNQASALWMTTGESTMKLPRIPCTFSTNSNGQIKTLAAVRLAAAAAQIIGWHPACINVWRPVVQRRRLRRAVSSRKSYQEGSFVSMCRYSMRANRKFTIRSIAGAQQKKAIAKSSCQAELVQEVPRHREILRLLHKANTTNPTARKGTATLQIGM